MQQLFQTLGPILAVAIPAILIARWIVRDRREMRELEAKARCGPGCICGGENVRARQLQPVSAQAPQPTTMIIQQPAPMAYQQPQPQIIVLQQPAPAYQPQSQPQIIMLQAPQPTAIPQPTAPQVIYMPPLANSPHIMPPNYQPQASQPPAQRPMSYYPGHSPEPADYPQEAYYLQPSQPVGQLPPARASDIDEARRRFEIERDEMTQGRRR